MKIKGFLCVLLAVCMLMGVASAGMPGLDEELSSYLDINDDVRYSFSLQVGTLPPYGEGTLEMLNAVLKHINIAAAITEDVSAMSLCVDEESVLDLTERANDFGTELTVSLLPNRTLLSAGSAMDALGGNVDEEPSFDALKAISETEACYQALTDAILPYAEQKKANYNIKGVGSSKWSRIARLTTDQSAELAPLIAQVLGCGMDQAYRERLEQMSYQKGFIVGLYQTAEGGDDLAVYIKGSVSFPEGGSGKLAYQWAFSSDGDKRVDTYKFELSGSKTAENNRTVSASYTRSTGEGVIGVDGEWKVTIKSSEGTVTTTVSQELSGEDSNGVRTLSGKLSTAEKTTVDGSSTTVTTTVTPEMKLTSMEGSGVLSGSVAIEQLTGKNTTLSLTLDFHEDPADALTATADSGELYAVTESGSPSYDPMPESSLTQIEEAEDGETADYLVGQPPIGYESHQAPAAPLTFNLDAATGSQMEALTDELLQNLAGRLLIALSALPREDIALLSDNMSDEDFASFLQLVEGL